MIAFKDSSILCGTAVYVHDLVLVSFYTLL